MIEGLKDEKAFSIYELGIPELKNLTGATNFKVEAYDPAVFAEFRFIHYHTLENCSGYSAVNPVVFLDANSPNQNREDADEDYEEYLLRYMSASLHPGLRFSLETADGAFLSIENEMTNTDILCFNFDEHGLDWQ